MDVVSLREFQLHAKKYLGKLPILLTQYKKPIAKVVAINDTSGDQVKSDLRKFAQPDPHCEHALLNPYEKCYKDIEDTITHQGEPVKLCEYHLRAYRIATANDGWSS